MNIKGILIIKKDGFNMNIVVLCAGISTEREVSIVTGKMVCEALRSKGHNARVLDIYFGTYKNSQITASNFFEGEYNLDNAIDGISILTSEVENTRKSRNYFFGPQVIEICQKADVVFMALHGENGENGKVQASFDLFGIKYTGTGYLGSALAMDKAMTKQLFITNNVPTPTGFKLNKVENSDNYMELLRDSGIKYPCVVKPCCGGSSIGVSIPNNDDEYKKAIYDAFSLEDEVIVEEYIKGREFSIGIINGKALPIIEIIPLEGFYDYENKYQPGKTNDQCPANLNDVLTKKMQEEALHANKVLHLDTYSRIDFLMDDKENIYCLEANTLPGMTATSLLPQEAAAIGVSYADLCEQLINNSIK